MSIWFVLRCSSQCIFALNDDIDSLETSFQDGCNIITSAITAKGITPASNSPIDISTAISNIETGKKYAEGNCTISNCSQLNSNGTYKLLELTFSFNPSIVILTAKDRTTYLYNYNYCNNNSNIRQTEYFTIGSRYFGYYLYYNPNNLGYGFYLKGSLSNNTFTLSGVVTVVQAVMLRV